MAPSEEEMVERLLAGYRAFNGGDFDGAVAMMDPEIEFTSFGEPSPLRGADAIRAWMEPDAFASQRIEPLRWRVKGDRALILQRFTARGAGSGIELDTLSWSIWTFDDEGRPVRVQSFPEHEREAAFEAAGLEGEEWPPEAEGGRPPGASRGP